MSRVRASFWCWRRNLARGEEEAGRDRRTVEVRIDRDPLAASSRRRPGPITPGLSFQARCCNARFNSRTPGVMGPGLRRDDGEVVGTAIKILHAAVAHASPSPGSATIHLGPAKIFPSVRHTQGRIFMERRHFLKLAFGVAASASALAAAAKAAPCAAASRSRGARGGRAGRGRSTQARTGPLGSPPLAPALASPVASLAPPSLASSPLGLASPPLAPPSLVRRLRVTQLPYRC
jgi:hypothetical protein